MMRALILLTAIAGPMAAAEVSPAVDLAADMVESRIVEGHPSARWLRSVAEGLRSGRITIQEASALLAMINHQAAFTAGPALPAPALGEPSVPPAAAPAQEPVAGPLPPVEAPDEPAVEPAASSEPLEVAEEGGAGGLLEAPPTADVEQPEEPVALATAGEGDEPGTAATDPQDPEEQPPAATDELAAMAAAVAALDELDQSAPAGPAAAEPIAAEPDLEGAIEALSRPATGPDGRVFDTVDTQEDLAAVGDELPSAPEEAAASPSDQPPQPVEPVAGAPPPPAAEPASTVVEAAPADPADESRPVARVVHVKLPTSADDPELVMLEGTRLRKGQTLAIRRDGSETVRVLVLRVEGTLAMAMVLGASWQPDAERPLTLQDQAFAIGG